MVETRKTNSKGEMTEMDESDSDSEANRFNKVLTYTRQGMDYILRL